MTSLAVPERVMLPDPARRGWPARLLTRAVNAIEATHPRVCAALILFSLACFLPGFSSLQPMDRDEPRFAQAAKQMLETGDFVDIRFQDEARHKKPIGIYWLQAAVVGLADAVGVPEARATIAFYRVPSLVGALASVLLTYWAALAFTTRRGAILAAALTASSILLIVEAHLAKTDAVLTACAVAVMGGLARAYLRREGAALSPAAIVLFWLGLSIGILAKGPIILMFAGLTALVLSIRERSARWLVDLRLREGIIATLVLVLPWFIAIAVKSEGGFFAASLGRDMIAKVGSAQESHWAPPGSYLIAFFATFWPGAILAAIAVPFAWMRRRDDAIAFALAWIVPSWILFEAVPTKLPHYVLPLYPAIAILAALAIVRGYVGPHRAGAKILVYLIPAIPAALAVGLVLAGLHLDGLVPLAALPFLLGSLAVAFLSARAFARGAVARAALIAAAASPLLALGVLGLAPRDLRSLKLSPRLAEVARGIGCEEPLIGSLGYREPSLVFLVGTNLELIESPLEAGVFLRNHACALVFVERRFEDQFREEAARLDVKPALTTRITGFNINSGRRLDLGAYAVTP
jgi:4-amino-4-deoxy-L-arabinose transferase-like glycosyltransferase